MRRAEGQDVRYVRSGNSSCKGRELGGSDSVFDGGSTHRMWWQLSLEHSSAAHESLPCYSKEFGL